MKIRTLSSRKFDPNIDKILQLKETNKKILKNVKKSIF